MKTIKYELICQSVDQAIETVKKIKQAHQENDDLLVITVSTVDYESVDKTEKN